MTEDMDELTQQEKIEKLKNLHNQLDEAGRGGILQDLDTEFEITARVIDEDGNEKHKQKERFEY